MIVLGACGGGRGVAPASDREILPAPNTYTVQRGDTLYSISWRYGMDYRDVARKNTIRSPYTIYVGQKLYLSGIKTTGVPTRGASSSSSMPAPAPLVVNQKVSVNTKPQYSTSSKLSWRWPASGTVVSLYSASAPGRKGIDIAGKSGQPVVAAAAGQVVYAGNGLPRYGNLLIIKHNDIYLSAYAHNQQLLVREGQTVQAGQQIAVMGRTGAKSDMLHFEIRHNGKSVDPMRFLPKP